MLPPTQTTNAIAMAILLAVAVLAGRNTTENQQPTMRITSPTFGSSLPQNVPYLAEYSGVWAIREREAAALLRSAENLNLSLHLQQVIVGAEQGHGPASQSRGGRDFLLADGGVAIVELSGTLMKQSSSFAGGTSTVEARRQIRAAARDPGVSSIVLLIDSPGGTAKGTADLADEVARATESKHVVAFVEDLAASAGYFVASQANEIVANQPEAIVGSLGTLMVVQDLSQMAEKEGIKVHVISTGPYKGMGTPGAEISDEHLAEIRREVHIINESFRRAVQRGRGLSTAQLDELFTGRVWPASEAMEIGLVDSIETFDALLDRLSSSSFEDENPARRRTRDRRQAANGIEVNQSPVEPVMSDTTTAPASPQPATITEIRTHCKGCDPAFVLEQLEKGATITACMTEWMDRQERQIAELREKQAKPEEQTKPAAKPSKGIGTTSLSDEETDEPGHDYAGDAVGTMLARRDEIKAKRKCSDRQAMKILRQSDPELVEQACAEYDQEFASAYRRKK